MCENCIRKMREQHAEDVKTAMDHLDASGVPEDSLIRGLSNIKLAMNAEPMLDMLMHEMWSTPSSLMQ